MVYFVGVGMFNLEATVVLSAQALGAVRVSRSLLRISLPGYSLQLGLADNDRADEVVASVNSHAGPDALEPGPVPSAPRVSLDLSSGG